MNIQNLSSYGEWRRAKERRAKERRGEENGADGITEARRQSRQKSIVSSLAWNESPYMRSDEIGSESKSESRDSSSGQISTPSSHLCSISSLVLCSLSLFFPLGSPSTLDHPLTLLHLHIYILCPSTHRPLCGHWWFDQFFSKHSSRRSRIEI